MAKKKPADVAPQSEEKANDNKADECVASGYDPFNGEVYLFKDSEGYWIENWRSNHYSEYLQYEEGDPITDEKQAMACFEAECANANFSCPVYQ
jgi:hypothetical protein